MMDERRPPRRIPWVRIAVGLGVLLLCVLLARKLDLARIVAALRAADWWLVALAGLTNLTFNTAARVGRWRALLAPLPRAGPGATFGELTCLYFAGQAASNLLPARVGEALRVLHLHRRHGYAVSGLVTVQIVEALIGAVTLGVCTLPMIPLGQAPPVLATAIFLFALAGPVGMALLLLLSRIIPVSPAAAVAAPARGVARIVATIRRGILRLVEAVRQIHAPRVWTTSLAWSVLSDASDVAMIGLVLRAVGISLSPASWVVIYAAVNLVLLAPTTPAQLGVLEVGAVAALRAFGVDEHPALAFALLYHAAHVVPPTVVGAILMLRLDMRRAAASGDEADRSQRPDQRPDSG
jgi:uncharacterized protein (TIRG00374 family)